MSSLYDRDFNLWIQKTVSNLNSKDMDAVDWEILIDKIEGMGKSDRRALRSYLERLIEHLLKLKYWRVTHSLQSKQSPASQDAGTNRAVRAEAEPPSRRQRHGRGASQPP